MRLGKRRRGRLREEGGWAWWLLSDSQERFSPSIGVLKAPWIINGLSLRSHPPLVLLFLLMSLCSLFPLLFPPSTLNSLPLLPPPPPFFPPLWVFIHLISSSLSHFLPALSQVHFCPFPLHPRFSIFNSLFSLTPYPPLPPEFICFSLIPLFSISTSISPSSSLTWVHCSLSSSFHLSLRLIFSIPASISSSCPAPYSLSLSFSLHFCSSSLFPSSPHISLSLDYISVFLCAFVHLPHS